MFTHFIFLRLIICFHVKETFKINKWLYAPVNSKKFTHQHQPTKLPTGIFIYKYEPTTSKIKIWSNVCYFVHLGTIKNPSLIKLTET